jgi:hypothetical protein
VQAVKAGKFEDRYENALVELLNQEAQARAGTNGRETAAMSRFSIAPGNPRAAESSNHIYARTLS